MKRLLALFLLLMVVAIADGAKNDPTPFNYRQPDGTVLTVRALGDESECIFMTMDGVLLVQTGKGMHVARITDDMELASSGVLAHDAGKRSSAELELAKAQPLERFIRERAHRTNEAKGRAYVSPDYFPHMGSPKVLVVLVQFQDTVFHFDNAREVFDNFFNAETLDPEMANGTLADNYCSIRQYFKEMSRGMFTPQFDVIGPITLPEKLSEEYNNSVPSSIIYVTRDAIPIVKDMVDLNEYDQDNNGIIDLIYFVAAGYDAARNAAYNSTTVHARTNLASLIQVDEELRTGTVCINGELGGRIGKDSTPHVSYIGATCHEFSHALGLPDLYPTTYYPSMINQSYEYWDLMDGGEHVRNGAYPRAYSALEREAMGWLEIETLDSPAYIEMTSLAYPDGKAYRIYPDPQDTAHCYILENVQKLNSDAYAYGHGLLVHDATCHRHFDPIFRPNDWTVTEHDDELDCDNIYSNSMMTIVPADGFVLPSTHVFGEIWKDSVAYAFKGQDYLDSHAGDTYPGSGMVTELRTTLTDIFYCGYDDRYYYSTKEGYRGPAVTDIRESDDGVISFRFEGGTVPVHSVDRPEESESFDLYGLPSLPGFHRIVISGGRKTITF